MTALNPELEHVEVMERLNKNLKQFYKNANFPVKKGEQTPSYNSSRESVYVRAPANVILTLRQVKVHRKPVLREICRVPLLIFY